MHARRDPGNFGKIPKPEAQQTQFPSSSEIEKKIDVISMIDAVVANTRYIYSAANSVNCWATLIEFQ